jgi:hypothetical protein
MSRVDAARFGAMKAVLPLAGCVAASDAFFPFPDGLETVAAAGATAVIQPGGSVKDQDVIAAADRLGIAMVFTGIRHFRQWAAVLSLLLWPLDAYRPARFAVAACYQELASFLASIYELASRQQPVADQPKDLRAPSFPNVSLERVGNHQSQPNPPRQRPALWHRLAKHHQYRIRRAVEHGWQSVASIRAERQSETAQGQQLVVLLEHADLLIARTIALAEHLEAQSPSDSSSCDDRGLSSLPDLRLPKPSSRRSSPEGAHPRQPRSRAAWPCSASPANWKPASTDPTQTDPTQPDPMPNPAQPASCSPRSQAPHRFSRPPSKARPSCVSANHPRSSPFNPFPDR